MPEIFWGGIIFCYELYLSVLKNKYTQKKLPIFFEQNQYILYRWNGIIKEMVENKNIINFENKLLKINSKV